MFPYQGYIYARNYIYAISCRNVEGLYIYLTDGFILREPGETCQDKGFTHIDLNECGSSTNFIKKYYPGYFFGRVENRPNSPKGCYAYINEDMDPPGFIGFFNTNPSDVGETYSRALCKIIPERLQGSVIPKMSPNFTR